MGGPTAISEARGFLARRLLQQKPTLVAAVNGEQLYGTLRPVDAGDVARATERIVEVVVGALVENARIGGPSERLLRRLGTRRAEQGIPLASVTAAFERATKAGVAVMKQAAMEWEEPAAAWDAFAELAAGLFGLVQGATSLVRDGFEDWDRSLATGRARADLSIVEDIFEGAWASATELIERSRTHGYTLTEQCLVVAAVMPPGTNADVWSRAVADAPSAGCPMVAGLPRGTPVPHLAGILPLTGANQEPDARQEVDAWAARWKLFALVESVEDMSLVPTIYRAMRDELGLVLAAAGAPGVVEPARQLHVPRLLQTISPERVESFIRTSIGGVLAQPPVTAERLLETLSAVFAWEGSHKRLATRLSLSHSGLRTRLVRVTELTGRQYKRDRVEISLALLLFRIHRASLPGLGDARWKS